MRFNSFEGRFCLTCCELWMPSVAGRFRVWNVPLLFKRVWTSEGARARSQKRLVPTQCFLYQVGFERNFQKNCFYILHAARLLEVKMCDLKKKKKKKSKGKKNMNLVRLVESPSTGLWTLSSFMSLQLMAFDIWLKKKKKKKYQKAVVFHKLFSVINVALIGFFNKKKSLYFVEIWIFVIARDTNVTFA